MFWSQNAVFNPQKDNFSLFSGKNKLAHDNQRVSNYKIMKKSQLRKFRFSGTLSNIQRFEVISNKNKEWFILNFKFHLATSRAGPGVISTHCWLMFLTPDRRNIISMHARTRSSSQSQCAFYLATGTFWVWYSAGCTRRRCWDRPLTIPNARWHLGQVGSGPVSVAVPSLCWSSAGAAAAAP